LIIFGFQTVKSQPNPKSEIQNAKSKTPVLVELYTSETCFSCPPAVVELSNLEQKQPYPKLDLVTLEFHVDYAADRIPFDIFSQPIFTQRQQIYGNLLNAGTIYTPQMIIDGRLAFTGSNKAKIIRDIPKAVDNAKGNLSLNLDKDLKLKINLSDLPKHDQSSVFIAIAEDKLIAKVKLGELSGQDLEHIAIVRELKSVGSLTSEQNSLEIETPIVLDEKWKRENLKIVVFVQENKMRKIHAVGQIRM
jgi:hypothetical protein